VPVAGMLLHTIAPFVDTVGALHWIDIFPPVQQGQELEHDQSRLEAECAIRSGPDDVCRDRCNKAA
jgi:hypothetical protein